MEVVDTAVGGFCTENSFGFGCFPPPETGFSETARKEQAAGDRPDHRQFFCFSDCPDYPGTAGAAEPAGPYSFSRDVAIPK